MKSPGGLSLLNAPLHFTTSMLECVCVCLCVCLYVCVCPIFPPSLKRPPPIHITAV